MNAWNIHNTVNGKNHSINFLSDFLSSEKDDLKLAIEACAEKAISLLEENIQDDSLYFMFEWDSTCTTLTVILTDASKQQDAPERFTASFSGLHNHLARLALNEREEQIQKYIELIKFWLYDYLTTSTAFLQYSLVAIFHSSSRDQSELL